MFKNPFSFDGRIRRTEYGLSYIIYIITIFSSATIVNSFYTPYSHSSFILLFIFIPLVWFLFAQGCKRCHDLGNSGFYQLIPFYFLWLLFSDSKNGVNQYGANPKGIGNVDEIDEIGNYLK